MVSSKTTQTSKAKSGTNNPPIVDRSDFDRWAEAVKAQMLNCLRKNKHYE
jgi:hypothetical protein